MTTAPLSVIVAGGGTAGHIEPAMAVADALVALDPTISVTALGTERGLDTTLIPPRGYPLKLIQAVPLPRKINGDFFRVPRRLWTSITQVRRIIREVDADVLIGFGGYVSISAYLAAQRCGKRGLPTVVHEANARAGIANKIGARRAQRVLGAVEGCGFPIEVVGIPVRPAISTLDRAALRSEAREFFGLDSDYPVILEFGGSQGAQSLNRVMYGASPALAEAKIGLLQAVGKLNYSCDDPTLGGCPPGARPSSLNSGSEARNIAPAGAPAQIQVPYISSMELAYAAADLVVCRSGAMTVAEITAVGLPAFYVPLPIGNGEQALNAQPIVDAGGGTLIEDSVLTAQDVVTWAQELLADPARYGRAVDAVMAAGSRNAADAVARIVCEVAGYELPTPSQSSSTTTQRKG